ncbi:hypothetical protein [Kitasatospora sp. GP82]|uniref:hypothetical protein n=1 Tax=Kitasatospora sp. GP82 TaxID=3035089 RepID=UPI002476F813|nr:hypothetical protein [Kitasatospora sp. GP82]MDH6126374.1 hypothetical protein [Kitasatospora sp. GP82]
MSDTRPLSEAVGGTARTAGSGPMSGGGAGTRPRGLERSAARCLGVALAVTACNPGGHKVRPGAGDSLLTDVVLPLAAAGFAWWAAPPPTRSRFDRWSTWLARLARHRNTVLAAGCVVLAALNTPPAWLAAAVTALLVGYLLFVDRSGPGRSPSGPLPAFAAFAAAGLVLSAALVPTGAVDWARPLAVLGVAVAAFGVGAALWTRPAEDPPADGPGCRRP